MKTRVISAIIMIALFIPIVILGKEFFAIAFAIIGIAGLRELLLLKRKEKEIPFLMEVITYITTLYIILNNYTSTNLALNLDYKMLCLFLLLFLIPTVLIGDNKKYSFKEGFYLLGASLLIGISFNLFILVRNYSMNILIYLFLITIITDTFALVTGKFIGQHKLCEQISPKKTVEGLIGGTIMGVFVASTFYLTIINPDINIIQLLIVTTTLSLMGQLGDLVFSQIKRNYEIKDFSNLIPGHGGILDRLDSIIVVVLTYILFVTII